MSYARGRYGLEASAVSSLSSHWSKKGLRCIGWLTFDDFLRWCSENGYQKNRFLRKRDEQLPHGPDNSFWAAVNSAGHQTKYVKTARWEKDFIRNWNENIHVLATGIPEEPESPKECLVWRYEHPDLVREGIV